MPAKPTVSRKEKMVAAAGALLRQRGLNGVTTRAIAEAVPCSEGAIYVHFKDRLDLLLAVLQDCLPEMSAPLQSLENKVGFATPAKNLEPAVAGLMRFHQRVTPMLCSLVLEPELLRRFTETLKSADKGPHRGIARLARYIEAEKALGRVGRQIDPKNAAFLLMASSFFHVFTARHLGLHSEFNVKRLIESAIGSSKDAAGAGKPMNRE